MRWRRVVGVLVLGLALGACVPPIAFIPPSVVGTAQVGQTLHVNAGQWLLDGARTYTWQRCDADGTGCATIGTTGPSYTAVAADLGKRLRVQVTNTNSFGTQTAYTGVSAIVTPAVQTAVRRVSVASIGSDANDSSGGGAVVSDDGRYVAFASGASNLVPGDTNGAADIFVHDTQTSSTTRVSVTNTGAPSNGDSDLVGGISSDGRYVAFGSRASNLVAGDTNGSWDVFVRDRQAGTTVRASVANDGSQMDSSNMAGFFSMSRNGRYISFASFASNLVPGDTNDSADVFLRDVQAGTTTRVSVATGGAQSSDEPGYPALDSAVSDDGRYVAFSSFATDLVANDTNGGSDVFVRDTVAGTTTRVSVKGDGSQASVRYPGEFNGGTQARISGNGRYVAFSWDGTDLVPGDDNEAGDVFVRDTVAGTTTRVSVASDGSQHTGEWAYYTTLSGNGRYVGFVTNAMNLVAGDTNGQADGFVHDLQTGVTTRTSVSASGAQGNAESGLTTMSSDGRYVVFTSAASNLVPHDINGHTDVFLHDRG